MAMTGRNQRGEEGLQPGRLQEHEGHVSLPFLLICLAWSLNDEVFDYGMFWRIVTESFWEKFSHDLPRSKLVNTRFCFQVRPEQAHLQSGQNKAPLGKKMFCYPCSHQCLLHQSLLNGEHFSRSSFKMLSLLYECLKQC